MNLTVELKIDAKYETIAYQKLGVREGARDHWCDEYEVEAAGRDALDVRADIYGAAADMIDQLIDEQRGREAMNAGPFSTAQATR